MARRPRAAHAAGFFHVINRSIRKTPLFQRATDYRAFVGVLEQGLTKHPVRLISYAILPNHWHLAVGPVDIKELSSFVQWITATHAIRWHRHRESVGQGPVYQGRFKSHAIVATGQLMRTCRYIERNALRAGLVRRAQDWPWCSLSERVSASSKLQLVSTPFLESDTWIQYVNAVIFPNEALAVWQTTQKPTSVPKTAGSVENTSVPLHDMAERPGGGKGGERGRRVVLAADDHESDAHVERTEHLGIRHVTRGLKPSKDWRHVPAGTIE